MLTLKAVIDPGETIEFECGGEICRAAVQSFDGQTCYLTIEATGRIRELDPKSTRRRPRVASLPPRRR